MASYDPAFRLDTDAYTQARRARTARTSIYWLILILVACGVAAAIAFTASHLFQSSPPGAAATHAALAPPPPVAQTRVAVWNVHARPAVVARLTGALAQAGYPIAGTRHARGARVRGTWVMYAPGAESAALGLARALRLKTRRVAPLDGVDPAAIAPATVLVLIGR